VLNVECRSRLPTDLSGAPYHRFGGSSGEGEQQDPPRISAGGDQLRDPVRRGGCFSGDGAGDDQQRLAGHRHTIDTEGRSCQSQSKIGPRSGVKLVHLVADFFGWLFDLFAKREGDVAVVGCGYVVNA